MSNKEIRKAKVKATGKTIQVYISVRGTWIDYFNCTTEYTENELQFLD